MSLSAVQICQVYDSAECVRNIHPDPTWRQAATAACQVGMGTAQHSTTAAALGWCIMYHIAMCDWYDMVSWGCSPSVTRRQDRQAYVG